MLKTLLKIQDGVIVVTLFFAVITLMLMMVLGAADATSGGLFGKPIAATQELSQVMLATVFFLVLGAAQRWRQHIAVDIVTGLLSRKAQAHFTRLGMVVGAIVLGIIAVGLWINAFDSYGILEKANTGVRFPIYPFKFFCAFGATAATFECIRQCFYRTETLMSYAPSTDVEEIAQ